MTGAISLPRGALAHAIHQLPPFMRRANTTYVDLRATLDELDPLVEESKPVARRLLPYVRELRGLTGDLRPTVNDLDQIIRRRGRDNDLVDLSLATLPLRDIAVGPVRANGKLRRGALPESAEALADTTPRVAFARPYTVDFMGWLDDFSHTGQQDALGGFSRSGSHFNAFTLKSGALAPLAPAQRAEDFQEMLQTGRNNRCPGAGERDPGDGSTPFRPSPSFNCDPSQVPIGP